MSSCTSQPNRSDWLHRRITVYTKISNLRTCLKTDRPRNIKRSPRPTHIKVNPFNRMSLLGWWWWAHRSKTMTVLRTLRPSCNGTNANVNNWTRSANPSILQAKGSSRIIAARPSHKTAVSQRCTPKWTLTISRSLKRIRIRATWNLSSRKQLDSTKLWLAIFTTAQI